MVLVWPMRAPWIICLFLALSISFSFAQVNESVIRVETWVDKATVTVGDRIIYTLLIKADSDLEVEPVSLGSSLGAFEIKDFKELSPQKDERGKSIYGYQYNLTIFEVGDFVIPPVEVTYTDPAGKKQKISTDKLFITVKSVSGDQAETADIRGLKTQIDVKGGYGIYYLLIFGAVSAIAVLLFYLRRRARALEIPEAKKQKSSAWEVAYSELLALSDSDLLNKGRIKEYFIILSEIIKRYIGERFSFSSEDRTTEELKKKLKKLKMEIKKVELVHSFFSFCDLVKFARYIPSPDEIDKASEKAKFIVDETVPKEELIWEKEEVA